MWQFLFGVRIPILNSKGRNLNKAKGAFVPARASKIKYSQVMGLEPPIFRKGMNRKLNAYLHRTELSVFVEERDRTWDMNTQTIHIALRKDVQNHIAQLMQLSDKKRNIRAIEKRVDDLKKRIGDRLHEVGTDSDYLVVELKARVVTELGNLNQERAYITMSGALRKAATDIAQALLERVDAAVEDKRLLHGFYMHIGNKGATHYSNLQINMLPFHAKEERKCMLHSLISDESGIFSILEDELGFYNLLV